jgi:pyruvate/2-oxoglutarate dehydrogenase complex dihydrolipoamide dehydrogenase (E3) component
MVAEEYRVGGTCVIRGCVPKKLLVYASRFPDEFADAAGFGWTVPEPRFDWATLIRNKDREIDRLEGIYRTNLEKAGVEIVNSRLSSRTSTPCGSKKTGQRIRARYILVAVGAHPVMEPPIPGGELGITSNEVFHLDRCRSAFWWSAAATSPWSSRACSRGSAARSPCCTGATSCSADSTRTCATLWARPMPSAAST